MHGPNADVSKLLTCLSCEFETSRTQSLENHTNSIHLNQKRVKCSVCDFRSYHGQIITFHMATKHADNDVEIERISCINCRVSTEHDQCDEDNSKSDFDCNYCNFKKTTSQEVIVSHMKVVHPEERLFHCNSCSYRCNWQYNLETHKKIVHKILPNLNSSEGRLDVSHTTDLQVSKCKACEFETKKMRYLRRHTHLMHGPNADVINVLTCPTCEFETKRNQSLEDHINAQHLNERRFSCNSCDFKSYYRQHMKIHIISRHRGSKPANMTTIGCSDCTSNIGHSTCKLPRRRARRRPTQLMTNEKANSAVSVKKENRMCQECSYVTQKRSYLRRHLDLSHGQNSDQSKIMSCKICEFETNIAQSLADHTNSIHLNQKRFNCSVCDLKSYFGNHIKSHMATQHAEGEVERISCNECRVNTEHDRCHEGHSESAKQNFDCNYCNFKSTTSQEVIVSHMKTFHPEERLFHCNNCSYRCNWLYNLRTHKTTEHKRKGTNDNSLEATFSGIIGLFIRHAETKIGVRS